jgi:hypothetical protein
MTLGFVTIGTVNHMPGIRVVLDSFAQHHPDAQLFTCLVDAHAFDHPEVSLPGIVFSADNLLLPGGRRFIFKFDAFELCCALKPFVASHVMQHYGIDELLYLDSDIMVFAGMTDSLSGGWSRARILCSPHFISWPQDAPELLRQIRQCGTYNAGFFALKDSPESRRFLSWWQTMCAEMGIYEPAAGLYVDQIWLDLVVAERYGFLPLLDPGLNVAYWNLSERRLEREGTAWMVNGQPLKFFHFSGFDAKQLTARRHFTPSPAHVAIAAEYSERLLEADRGNLRALPYGFATYEDGFAIAPGHRRAIFRNEPALAAVTDPFRIREDPQRWRDMTRASGELTARLSRSRRLLNRLRMRAAGASSDG